MHLSVSLYISPSSPSCRACHIKVSGDTRAKLLVSRATPFPSWVASPLLTSRIPLCVIYTHTHPTTACGEALPHQQTLPSLGWRLGPLAMMSLLRRVCQKDRQEEVTLVLSCEGCLEILQAFPRSACECQTYPLPHTPDSCLGPGSLTIDLLLLFTLPMFFHLKLF